MKVLAHAKWSDEYLDYYRSAREYRVRIIAWRTLVRVEDLYFVRPRSLRMIYNYLREVGAREVWRKVISRTREGVRNAKYVSCGIGQILEQSDQQEFALDQLVVFCAPSHPACVERLVLPAELLTEAPLDLSFESEPGSLLYVAGSCESGADSCWDAIAGWSESSGAKLPPNLARTLERALEVVVATDWKSARHLPSDATASASERRTKSEVSLRIERRPRTKSAVLIGYGNYAKTIILPNLGRYVRFECIHEIDPTQMPLASRDGVFAWDTAPAPRADAHHDVWVIAGYHDTHASLAVRALELGSYAVVEKPLATARAQLDSLAHAIKRTPRMFAGFHKRYSPMNDWARADLAVAYGEPISYHCIVYEVPLPARHWYRWPAARSRIVSNGCHWIDHFLFLNGYSPVDALDVQRAHCGTVNCFVTLRNGACFSLVLTDEGSARVGVQEHIELRANGTTVRITDGSSYRAESSYRVLRRARVHKYSGFRQMYRTIGKAIQDGQAGDSPESIIASTELVLALEEIYCGIRA